MQVIRFFTIIKFRAIYFSTSLGHYSLIDKVGLISSCSKHVAEHVAYDNPRVYLRSFLYSRKRWLDYVTLTIFSVILLLDHPPPTPTLVNKPER
jgi:hypothetical protein